MPKRTTKQVKKDRSTPSQTGGVTESEHQRQMIRKVRAEGTLEEYRKQMAEAAKGYVNPPSRSGFDLRVRILSATILDGDIHCMVSFSGEVETPDGIAISKGEVQEVIIPAKLTPVNIDT